MNRILFERGEIDDGIVTFRDVRAEHVLNVLHGEVGQTLKTGEIGEAEIVAIADGAVTVRVTHDREPLPSWVDLVLAPPRPRVMKRLLPQLATMGVGRIFLVGAKKVEKDFWGATLLKAENYLPLLVDGLMQGGVATEMPVVETRRNLRKFIREELDGLFAASRKVIAHPYGDGADARADGSDGRRLLLAVGPEGGWTDEEVALFEAHGFVRYSLGRRILRTDTALISLLAKLDRDNR